MKASLLIMTIYKRYLRITADLITILEKKLEKMNGNVSPEVKEKYKEFRNHAHTLIEDFNTDLHKLLRIDWELKELEEKEN